MDTTEHKLRILLIGPGSLEKLGGTTVSFHHLQQAMKASDSAHVEVLSSMGVRDAGMLRPFRLVQLMASVFSAMRRCDVVSFHAMPTALPYIGWFLVAAARLLGKPLLYRSFGGMYYDELPTAVERKLAAILMRRADVVLLQTRELMTRSAQDQLRRVEWLPTARPMPHDVPPRFGPCRRFIYVGQLWVAKGLQYLARAAASLPEDATVDVYGPWYDLPRDTFEGCNRIRYVGVLQPDQVVSTLGRYDALVFPTFLAAEGHSGIVLEAYAAGIPVVATRWKALPEIVEDGVSGLLIAPRNEEAILKAMMLLYNDNALYARLAAGTQLMREQFSIERQREHFLRICREVSVSSPKCL